MNPIIDEIRSSIRDYHTIFIGGWPVRFECSNKDVDAWYLDGKADLNWSLYYFLSGLVFLIILGLVIQSICTVPDFLKSSCFKIMLFIAIIEWTELWTCSIWPAYVIYHGGVFCTNPKFSFLIGKIIVFQSVCSSAGCATIGLNRLADITDRKRIKRIFDKSYKVGMVIGIILLLALFVAIFSDPCPFDSNFKSFLFVPMNGNKPDIYNHRLLILYNVTFVISNLIIYGLLILQCLADNANSWQRQKNKQKTILHALTMGFLFTIPIFGYLIIFLTDGDLSKWFISTAQMWFQINSGLSGILFLIFNQTIRSDVLRKVCKQKPVRRREITRRATSTIII